jgi:heptosyltransferase-3
MRPRILVIRGGAIGDFVLTLPAIKLLRENFPHAHLEILGYRHIVALAEGRFYADASRSIEYAALSRFFIPNAELPEEMIEYFASFQQIVSYLYDPDKFFENNLLRCGVKHFLHASPKVEGDTVHAAQQLAHPLERMALFLENTAATLHPSAADREAAARLLSRDGTSDVQPKIALHPGSGSAKKNWPLENWLALGERLSELEPRLLLIGGEADHAALAKLEAAWKNRDLLVARDLPLPTVAALLEKASVFVGHDSGISHIAAAAGAPCVLLFGPTDPDVWAPTNQNVTVLRAPDGALEKLDVETVAAAVRASHLKRAD